MPIICYLTLNHLYFLRLWKTNYIGPISPRHRYDVLTISSRRRDDIATTSKRYRTMVHGRCRADIVVTTSYDGVTMSPCYLGSVEIGSVVGGHSTGYKCRTCLLSTPVSVRTDTTRTTPSELLRWVAMIRPKRQSRRGVPGSSIWKTVSTRTAYAVASPESGRRNSSRYSFTKTRLKL